MAEETVDETQDSQTDEVDDSTEESSSEDVETLKAEIARKDKIIQDQKGRADKAEIQLKKARKESQSETNEPTGSISDEKYERLELKISGYSQAEVDSIMDLGGLKVLDNAVVQAGIATARKRAKSQDATPSGTAKSPVYQKYSERDLRNMPLGDLEKIIPQGD